MFGHDDSNQTVMGSPTVQNPSMLDNVSQQDFQTNDSGAQQTAPQQDSTSQTSPAPVTATDPAHNDTSIPPYEEKSEPEHPITTDNPFAQDPISGPAASQPASTDSSQTDSDPSTSTPPEPTDTPAADNDNDTAQLSPTTAPNAAESAAELSSSSPSGPVNPPVVVDSSGDSDSQDNSSYLAALSSSDDDAKTDQPVDHEKLADMKQQALAHLEPLADHIDGTPEETFKTTMMMIQANDNHTLLEKALESAKKIEDDKIRAQAMLDIINEINYFSQNSQDS